MLRSLRNIEASSLAERATTRAVTREEAKKAPDPQTGGYPFGHAAFARGTAPLNPAGSLLTPGSRLPRAFPGPLAPVASLGIAPRSQWRDRAGFSPASLFSRRRGALPHRRSPNGVSNYREDSVPSRGGRQAGTLHPGWN